MVRTVETRKPIRLARLALGAMLVATTPALAQDGDQVPDSAFAKDVGAGDACEMLAPGPVEIANRMTAFETVYGKDAMYWTQSDYDRLFSLADACDGQVFGGSEISAAKWRQVVDRARRTVLPVGMMMRDAVEWGKSLGSDGIAYRDCRITATSSAVGADLQREAFGRDFLSLPANDLGRAVDFLNRCKPVLEEWSRVVRRKWIQDVRKRVDALMDQALLTKVRLEHWSETTTYNSDLVLKRDDGVLVPPTFLAKRTRELVEDFNRWSRSGARLSLQATGDLMRASGEILEAADGYDDNDRLYARAIRDRVEKEVFDR